MKNLLLTDKIPYFLTVFIALATYQINKIISLEEGSPTIVYKFSTVSEEKNDEISLKKDLECELRNISMNTSFHNLEFYISYRNDRNDTLPEPYYVFGPKVIAISPAMIWADTLAKNADSLLNAYTIPSFQPSSRFIIKLSTIENKKIKEYPKIYINSINESVRLIPESFSSVLVENVILVNVFLLLIWLGLIFVYSLYILKNSKEK